MPKLLLLAHDFYCLFPQINNRAITFFSNSFSFPFYLLHQSLQVPISCFFTNQTIKGWIDENTFTAAKPGTGLVIAVRKLQQETSKGHREWLAEVNYLAQFEHPNLVKLIDYCSEDDHRLLVYEFLPRGSLENHLFRRGSYFQPLSWSLRLKLLLELQRGMKQTKSCRKDDRDILSNSFL